jgi:hypothetical protein
MGTRIGTMMPGLLPRISLGSESELGRAVSQLTGLSALTDLSDHVRRAKSRIDKEFVKQKLDARSRADADYLVAKGDLEQIFEARPTLRRTQPIPLPSAEKTVETELQALLRHFETAKSVAFTSAGEILGESFDPADTTRLSDLERNIGRALERVSRPEALPSASRLAALRKLTATQLNEAEGQIRRVLSEARTLQELASNPSQAARARLYARVAAWSMDHPEAEVPDHTCAVCSRNLDQAVDPVTGRPVWDHLRDAATDAELLARTLRQWSDHAQGELLRSLPEALRQECVRDLPAHPCDLLRTAIIEELFDFEPFRGVLNALKIPTAASFDALTADRAALEAAQSINLPSGCEALGNTVRKLDTAIRFARWRHANDALAREISSRILGRVQNNESAPGNRPLASALRALEAVVKAAQPISDALTQCERLLKH